jgi:hypothetical protein
MIEHDRPTLPPGSADADAAEFESKISLIGEWRVRLAHLVKLVEGKNYDRY